MRFRLYSIFAFAALFMCLLVLFFLSGFLTSNPTRVQAEEPCEFFPDITYSVCGTFLTYWQTHGGLTENGYPISDTFREQNAPLPVGDGKMHVVQYFQHVRFELHPENKPPYDVLVGLRGGAQYEAGHPGGNFSIASTPAAALSADVRDGHITSPILGRTISYRIYLPPDYDTKSTRYPVLYMLHGLAANYLEWSTFGLLSRTDEMIRAGQLPPYIIVLPMGYNGYWVNHANGGSRWSDYLTTDVVGYIDATYRTIANADNRAIGGLSMGGYGALSIGFNHPELFKIIGSHSPIIYNFADRPDIWGTDPAYFAQIDPITLAKTKDLTGYKIWLDAGKSDTRAGPKTTDLHTILQGRNIVHTYNRFDGTHQNAYWASHVLDYSSFYAHAFTYK